MYFDFHQPSLGKSSLPFHQPSLGGFSTFSNMKMMMTKQQEKLNHLSSKLSQSNNNSEPQTTQDNQPYLPRQQFPEKLYHMLEMADAQGFGPSSNAVSWLPTGRAFTVRDEKVFMESIVPLFFNQTKMRSFARQLNLWGFKRLNDTDSCTYCHERFVRGSPEELQFMVRITIKSKSNASQKKSTDLPLEINGVQLQHREDDCTQVYLSSLSDVHVSSPLPIPWKSLKSKGVSMEADAPHPTSQYLLAELSFKRRVSMQDDDEPADIMSGVGISRHDPIMLALNKGSTRSKHVSSQSTIPRESLKCRRVSMEADVSPSVSPSVSSVGYPPSQYSVAERSFKRRVTMDTVGMLDQVGILALNEGVPRDEFAEFIDHMIHLV